MFKRPLISGIVLLLAAGPAVLCADEVVTLTLTSTQDTEAVLPGDPIDWDIDFQVASGSHKGLALLLVDFVQDWRNPELIEIPVASSIGAAIDDFDAPGGICNITNSPANASLFTGTQLGTDCYADLYQIGGAQNTTGVAGTRFGTSVTVQQNIGASLSDFVSGSFDAPETRGIYRFRIQYGEASVLDDVTAPTPPDPWPVLAATVEYSDDEIFFVVCPGDVDHDGNVDYDDLNILLAAYGTSSGQPGYDPDVDFDDDGDVDFDDLNYLMAVYGDECME